MTSLYSEKENAAACICTIAYLKSSEMRGLARVATGVACIAFFLCVSGTVLADTRPPALAAPTGLSILEIKMTGDEYLLLQNNTPDNIDDLSSYWLYAFNNVDPLASGVSSSSQQLPATRLAAGQTLLLNAVPQPTCGAAVGGKLSISLTDSGGFLEIIKLSRDSSGALQQTAGDNVSWSAGASGQIQNVPSASKDGQAVWYRYQALSGYSWQRADIDVQDRCQLDVVTTPPVTAPAPTGTLLQPSSEPPATIVSVQQDQTVQVPAGPVLPAGDIDLAAPQITELLPNPNGTGTDTTDEFIELYNSNDADFDLTGFTLQTGISTKHSYLFPAGTILPARSFVAFYSEDTGLSLSNSGSSADLLDPFGSVIAESEVYGSAKDGQAWARANGNWYWTTRPTPNAPNVITEGSSAAAVLSAKSKSTATKTKANSQTKTVTPSNNVAAANSPAAETVQVTPIHPWTLALVAALAVAYGLYEYRLDVANRIYQFRRNRAARRGNR